MSESEVTTLEDAVPAKRQSKAAKEAPDKIIAGSNHDAQLSGESVTLTIHISGEDGGADAVSIGLNGYAFQIPRGVPCRVPAEVARVIEQAVVEEYKQNGSEVARIERPRFAYSIAK